MINHNRVEPNQAKSYDPSRLVIHACGLCRIEENDPAPDFAFCPFHLYVHLMTKPPPLVISKPENTTVIEAFGDQMKLHLGTKETEGRFTLWTNVTPPGGGPPPHYHENEDEWFWPLSGNAEFLIDGDWTQVPANTSVYAPRMSVHAFRNPNSEPLEMLIQTIPGGFDNFFAECAKEFNPGQAPDMKSIVEISARYGIYYV